MVLYDSKTERFNPERINYISNNLNATAVALSLILEWDTDNPNFIYYPYIDAAKIIADVQNMANLIHGECPNLEAALDHYNRMRDFIEVKGLKDEYANFCYKDYMKRAKQ